MVNFNTYVINLKHDKKKLADIEKELKKVNLKFIRFDAINGRNVNKKILNKHVNKICDDFCPNSVIGCGLSHLFVAKKFLETDENEFALILEDDVIPLNKNVKEEIIEIVQDKKNIKWDIIKLYCFGLCSYDGKTDKIPYKYFTGSNAAYLLSKDGAKKISKYKLNYHIDTQYNFSDLKIYKSPKILFRSYFDKSSNSIKNKFIQNNFNIKINEYDPPLYFPLQIKIIRIPMINMELCVWQILIVIILFIIFYKKNN